MIEIKLYCNVVVEDNKNFAKGTKLEVIKPFDDRFQVRGKHRDSGSVEMWIKEKDVSNFRFCPVRAKANPDEYRLGKILALLATSLREGGASPYTWGFFSEEKLLDLIQEFSVRLRSETENSKRSEELLKHGNTNR